MARQVQLVIAGMTVPIGGPQLPAGTALGAKIGEAISSCSIALTMDQASQITLKLYDPGHKMLREGMVPPKGLILWAPSLSSPQDFVIATREATGTDETTIIGRDRGVERCKNIKGPIAVKNLSPADAFIKLAAGQSKFVTQPSASFPDLAIPAKSGSTPAGDLWTSAEKWVEDHHLGYVQFSSGGTIYYGQPSYLVPRMPYIPLDYLNIDDAIFTHIGVRDSIDAIDADKTLTLGVHMDLGMVLQPGTVIKLSNHSPDFDGDYWVRSCSGDLLESSTWNVDAAKPPADKVYVDDGTTSGTAGASGTTDTGGVTLPGKGSTYTPLQIAALLRSVGWPESTLKNAIATFMAESGGSTTATNTKGNTAGGIDRGLFQINSKAHPEVSEACAFDPLCAVKAAFTIARQGTSLQPWVAYSSGRYMKFLPQAATAIATLNKPPPSLSTPPQPAGSLAGTPRQTLLVQLQDFATRGQVTFASLSIRSDIFSAGTFNGAAVEIDNRILRSLMAVAEFYKINVSSAISSHPTSVNGEGGSVSPHKRGLAVDINSIDGTKVINYGSGALSKLSVVIQLLAHLPSEYRPTRISKPDGSTLPGIINGVIVFADGFHNTNLHWGYN